MAKMAKKYKKSGPLLQIELWKYQFDFCVIIYGA